MLIHDKQTYQEICASKYINIHAPSGRKESLNPLILYLNKPKDEQSNKIFPCAGTNNYMIPVDDSITTGSTYLCERTLGRLI